MSTSILVDFSESLENLDFDKIQEKIEIELIKALISGWESLSEQGKCSVFVNEGGEHLILLYENGKIAILKVGDNEDLFTSRSSRTLLDFPALLAKVVRPDILQKYLDLKEQDEKKQKEEAIQVSTEWRRKQYEKLKKEFGEDA